MFYIYIYIIIYNYIYIYIFEGCNNYIYIRSTLLFLLSPLLANPMDPQPFLGGHPSSIGQRSAAAANLSTLGALRKGEERTEVTIPQASGY